MFVNQHEIRMVGKEKRRASDKQTPAQRHNDEQRHNYWPARCRRMSNLSAKTSKVWLVIGVKS